MKKNRLTLGLMLAALLAAGCAGPAKTTVTTEPAAPAEQKEAANEQLVLAGKVVETMTVANYTYVRLEKDGKSGWAAVPTRQVAVGDEVELLPGTEMGQFNSPSLKKTFKNIYFSTGFKGAEAAPAAGNEGNAKSDAAALPSGHPKVDMAKGAAAKIAAPANANLISGKVVETANAGGYTYICLEKDGKKTWAAVPVTQVKVGEELKLLPGGEMNDFTSKSLNKTFDKIIFSGGIAE